MKETVEKQKDKPAEWSKTLFPLTKNPAAGMLLISVNKYTDCMRVSNLSVASYGGQGGVAAVLKDDQKFQSAQQQFRAAKAAVQVLALIQAMYRDGVDAKTRTSKVAEQLGNVPQGAVPQAFLDVANAML